MLFLGVVFARLFYILNPPPSVAALYSREWYLIHPLDLQIGPLAVWSGGLGMAGMLFGAVLGALLVLWRQDLDSWLWADITVPGLLLVLIIAPWGNLLRGQMIGLPTELPWGIGVAYPPSPYPPDTLFHPIPAYLSLWALLLLCVVWGAGRLSLKKGDIFLGLSLLYGIGLCLADLLRIDVSRSLLGFSGMQTLALGIVLWASGMIGVRFLKRKAMGGGEIDQIQAGNSTS